MNKITAEEAQEALSVLRNDANHLYNTTNGEQHEDHREDVELIQSFINQQLKANEPLTEEEWKKLEDNKLKIYSYPILSDDEDKPPYYAESYSIPYIPEIGSIYGVGHTKDQAARDAYRQLEERGLI